MSDIDQMDDITPLITRAFAVALGHILREKEGIVVKLDDGAMTVVVHRGDDEIRVSDHTDDAEMCAYEGGQMLWLHDDAPMH